MENIPSVEIPGSNTEKEKTTAIDKLNALLGERLDEEYEKMVGDTNVKLAGFKPTKEQFRQYCLFFKKGLEYVSSKYGNSALPENLDFRSGKLQIGDLADPEFIGYMPETDNVVVSFLHIASQCARYDRHDQRFFDSHLPKDYGVYGEDYTVLQAIEEGYHRYQIHELSFKSEDANSERNINHPLEKEIIPIFATALKDLNIKLHYLPDDKSSSNLPESDKETGPEDEKRKRWDCLIKLAIGLGATKAEAKEKAYEVMDRDDLAGIDLTLDEDYMKAEDIAKILRVGARFIPQNKEGFPNRKKEFQFEVGLRALQLAKDPLDSAAFKSLDTMIGLWTFGKGEAGTGKRL